MAVRLAASSTRLIHCGQTPPTPNIAARLYDPRGNSVSSCAAACWQRGLHYAAVQSTRCECGDQTLANDTSLLPIGDCQRLCRKFKREMRCNKQHSAMNGTTFWNGTVAYTRRWSHTSSTLTVGIGLMTATLSGAPLAVICRNLLGYLHARAMVLCGLLQQQGVSAAESQWWCDKTTRALRFYAENRVQSS